MKAPQMERKVRRNSTQEAARIASVKAAEHGPADGNERVFVLTRQFQIIHIKKKSKRHQMSGVFFSPTVLMFVFNVFHVCLNLVFLNVAIRSSGSEVCNLRHHRNGGGSWMMLALKGPSR